MNEQCGACPWPPPVTPTSQYRPTGPFRAMLERIAPYSLAGFLWYQGEEDEPYCGSYRELLGMLIGEWRAHLEREPAVPHRAACRNGSTARRLDETARRSDAAGRCCARPNGTRRSPSTTCTSSAPSIVASTTTSIPLDKRTPGERLADCALRQVYGMSRIPVYGPTVLGFRCDPNGRVRLFFRYAHGLHFDGTTPGSSESGLRWRSRLRWCVSPETLRFRACGRGRRVPSGHRGDFRGLRYRRPRQFQGERGRLQRQRNSAFPINSRSIGTIMLACPDVPEPMSMRYAWRSWGPAPLFNSDGLPAQPFRLNLTDHTASNDDGE